jgi:anti-anti-sigma factor
VPSITTFHRPPLSDVELIRRCGRGDRAALGALRDRHLPGAYRLACAVCVDVTAAERAIEQAFSAIAEARVDDGPRGDAAAWLIGFVYRHALVEARHGTALRGPLASLPDRQGELVALVCFGEFSRLQIAEHLHVPAGAVDALLDQALGALQLATTTGQAPAVLPAPASRTLAPTSTGVSLPLAAYAIRITWCADAATITMTGELDIATRREAELALDDGALRTARTCLMDLRGLTFLDAGGVRLLTRLAARSQADGCALSVMPPVTGAAARMMRFQHMHLQLMYVGAPDSGSALASTVPVDAPRPTGSGPGLAVIRA